MTEQQARAGGRVTGQTIFVNADNVTMVGNGTIEHPLTAIGGGGQTVEHLTIEGESGAADPDVNVTFVTTAEEVASITLADGDTDGFQKTIEVAQTGAQYEIVPTNLADGTSISLTAGGVRLVWNADDGEWAVMMVATATINP